MNTRSYATEKKKNNKNNIDKRCLHMKGEKMF